MKIIKLIVVCIVIIITYYSLRTNTDNHLPTNDKFGHFLAYQTLSFNLYLLCFSKKNRLYATLFMISYGFLMEMIQSFIPEREPSFYDMIANSSGVFSGLGIVYVFQDKILYILRKIKVIS